jgi:hypothetical protein
VDLGFARLKKYAAITALPIDLAVLLVGVSARQAASRTARTQTQIPPPADPAGLLEPQNGCFDSQTASALTRWQQE